MIINGFGGYQTYGTSTLIKTVTTTVTSKALDRVTFSESNTRVRKNVSISVAADAEVYADRYRALYWVYKVDTSVTPSGNATWSIRSTSIGSSSMHYMWIGAYDIDDTSFTASNSGSAPTTTSASSTSVTVSINYGITWPTGTTLAEKTGVVGFLSWKNGTFIKITGIGSGTQSGTLQGNLTTPYPLALDFYVGFDTGSNSNKYTSVVVGPVTFGYMYSLYGIS